MRNLAKRYSDDALTFAPAHELKPAMGHEYGKRRHERAHADKRTARKRTRRDHLRESLKEWQA